MKKHEKWMPLYIAEYLADTSRLTIEQHGVYLLLIMDYWRNGPPPDNPEILARIVGATPDQWLAISPPVRRLFQVVSGQWRHKRVEAELLRAQEISDNLSDRGKQGAEARWGNGPSNATGIQQAMLEQCLVDAPSPSPSPSTLDRQPKPKNKGNGAHAPFILPDWIPQEHWDAWVEARTKCRKPPTDYAKRLAVKRLDNFRQQGSPPAQVLMQSAMSGWANVFPLKEAK